MSLIQHLTAMGAAQTSEEKAAQIVELVIGDLPPDIAVAARRCGLLPWFTADIITALLPDSPPETHAVAIVAITTFPFVETLPWGYTFHQTSHAGLLAYYTQHQPEEIRRAYAVATPCWLAAWEQTPAAVAALQGLLITDQPETVRERLDDLTDRFVRVEDWNAILGLYASLAALSPLVQTPLELTARDHRIIGMAHAGIKDYASALTDYGKAIELNPQYDTAYYNRGGAYTDLQQYDAALADYGKAIELNPQYADAYNDRGYTYCEMKQYDATLADLGKAIELNPGTIAYNNRGYTYYKMKQYDAALADYGKAIELNPQDAAAYNNRGLTYYKMKQYDAAITDYGKAIELNPQAADAYFCRGCTYHEMKQYDAALADYGKTIELNPQNAIVYNNRGYTYHEMKQYDAALADYDKAIELNPQDADAYFCRGITYAKKHDYRAFLADFMRAIKLALTRTFNFNAKKREQLTER